MTKQYCHNKKRKFLVKRGWREPYKIFIRPLYHQRHNFLKVSNMNAMTTC